MNNPTESKQQYECAILSQLIKNSERLAVVENDITQIKSEVAQINKALDTAKGWLIAILIGVIVNIFSQPLLNFLN